MYNLFLIVGAIIIVIGLMFLRIRYSPVFHPDAKLFINLLSMSSQEKERPKK